MRLRYIDWGKTNVSHATRHGVTQAEIEDMFFESEWATVTQKVRGNRFITRGQTSYGRFLLVVEEQVDKKLGGIIIVSARDMAPKEKAWFRDAKTRRAQRTWTDEGRQERSTH